MKQQEVNGYSIAKLSKDQALDFLIANLPEADPDVLSNLQVLGAHKSGRLIGGAALCNPRSRSMRKRYTTELLDVVFEDESETSSGTAAIIEAYLKAGAWDLFTYASTIETANQIYLSAGLELIPSRAPNQVIVRNGISYQEAQNNWLDWFDFGLASTLGPGKLLNAKIPQHLLESKSSIDLFINDFGYHVETVAEADVYAWVNPKVSFYTYRISSTVDSGYYIGRRAIPLMSPTAEDCLTDGYTGSGGVKFKNWMENTDKSVLVKTILSIQSTWEEAVISEREAIGDLYLADPDCMNRIPGGVGPSRSFSFIDEAECSTHGLTLHNGKSCLKCASAKIWTKSICSTHGKATFRSGRCERCSAKNLYSTKACPTHGEVTFRANSCLKCISNEILTERECASHGLTLHLSATCATCTSQKAVNLQECSIHGMTKHQGDVCSVCHSQASVSTRECAVHGEAKHQGMVCMSCNAEGQMATKRCPTHGEVTHKGNACTVCTAQKAIAVKHCPSHGEVKHQGDVCTVCASRASVSMKTCPIHGETKHQGNVCSRCNAQASVALEECSIHGASKFQGGKCVKCRNAALIGIRDCAVHGKVKHRGQSCYPCIEDRKRAKREAKKAAL